MRVLVSIILSVISFTACAGPVDPCAENGNILWDGLRTYQGPIDRQQRIEDVIGQEAWGFDNALTVAVWFGYDDVIRKLVHDRDVLEKYGAQSLYLAASMGRLKEMSLLLDAGVSPNAEIENGFTPVYGAAEYGCVQAMQLLVNSGANVNHRANAKWSLLKFAVISNQLDAARFLITHGYLADDAEREKVQRILDPPETR